MQLLIVYVVLALAGELVVVAIGLFLDYELPTLSLPISLALFFATLGVTWPIAVKITERWLVRQ